METVTETHSVLTRAAFRARIVHPGPLGVLVCRELLAAASLGQTFGGDALAVRVATEVLRTQPSGSTGGRG